MGAHIPSCLTDLFAVSVSSALETFNKVIKTLMAHMYNQFVKMSDNNEEWESKLQ